MTDTEHGAPLTDDELRKIEARVQFGEYARVNSIPDWENKYPIPIDKALLPQKNNTSGYRGVSFAHNRWSSRIEIDGRKIHLGMFNTAELAYAAYCEALQKHRAGLSPLPQRRGR